MKLSRKDEELQNTLRKIRQQERQKEIEALLTKEYLESGGDQCLHCKSRNIEVIDTEKDQPYPKDDYRKGLASFKRTVECHDCGKLWYDFHKLVTVEFVEEEDDG